MAYILHIDTSADTGVVALAKDGQVLAATEQTNARNHAATINNDIEQLLKANNIGLGDISAFCVNGGPGSYTGLRIGLATAKGYCYALDKPLMMHNRLLLLCLSGVQDISNTADTYMAVLPAREGEYFAAAYDKELNAIQEPQHVDMANIGQFTAQLRGSISVAGYVDEIIMNSLQNADVKVERRTTQDAAAWARYSFEEYNCNRIVSLANTEPFYLKQVYTHKPKNVS
ncbi:MAG: tRNA (adenosine(37)-N6)-threonylcarbamoyltransferase complex dimerization subunit type 1 TsaB [Taibaiella sp.]|nr:tRNA (adenosine(37)-N6)-threonylcarbamoyltransferase complex dimerization subunit type 1 TsaB [Taibaiella sp.]